MIFLFFSAKDLLPNDYTQIDGEVIPASVDTEDSVRFTFTAQSYGNILVGDYNSDKDYDILLSSAYRALVPGICIDNQGDTFEELDIAIVDVYGLGRGQAWGDIDNDNDLDLIVSGMNENDYPVSVIYRNDGMGGFTDIHANVVGISESAAAFGDLDNDGDQDLVLSGLKINGLPTAKIYHNQGQGNFVETDIYLEGLSAGSILICDIDNDMDKDILMNGFNILLERQTILLRNDSRDVFTSLDGILPGIGWGMWKSGDLNIDGRMDLVAVDGSSNELSIAIQGNNMVFENLQFHTPESKNCRLDLCDYNCDGDMDVLLSSGEIYGISRNGAGVKLQSMENMPNTDPPGDAVWVDWFNDSTNDILFSSSIAGGAILFEKSHTNTVPAMPTNLSSENEGRNITLSWSRANDNNETAAYSLSYNLRIGTTPGGTEILSPMSDSTGFHRILSMGNCSLNPGWKLVNLPPGKYYWSVQTIDQGNLGSAFAEEDSFEIQFDYHSFDLAVDSIEMITFLSPADFDNDGDFDYFSLARTPGRDSFPEGQGGVLWNHGDSTYVFESMGFLDSIYHLSDVAFSDYNNDGYVDMAISMVELVDSSVYRNSFYVIENKGGVEMIAQPFIKLDSSYCSKVCWTDWDNDGDSDLSLVIISSDSLSKISLYENIRSDSFSNVQELSLKDLYNVKTKTGDFNADGRIDLIVLADSIPTTNRDESICISKFFQADANGWTESNELSIPALSGNMAISDYNGDGFLDIMTYGSSNEYDFRLQIYENRLGQSLFETNPGIPGINQFGQSRWGDFNLDGLTDVYVYQEDHHRNTNEFKVYYGLGSDESERILYTEGPIGFDSLAGIRSFNLFDMDGDSDLDMAITGESLGASGAGFFVQNTPSYAPKPMSPPSNLVQSPKLHGVILKWDPSTDGVSYYNVRVGTRPGGMDIVSPLSDTVTGAVRILFHGNAGCSNTFVLDSLADSTYYWSVQRISENGVGGSWATESSFLVDTIELDFEMHGSCTEDTILFTDRSIGPISNWLWDFGDGDVSTLQNPVHAYKDPGDYEVVLKTEYNGFRFTHCEEMSIKKGVKVDFNFGQVETGEDVPFENLTDTLGVEIQSWLWDFGDESQFEGFDPVNHSYDQQGIYWVSLSALAFNGCADTMIKKLDMCNDLPDIPTIFVGGPPVWYLICSDTTVEYYQWYYNGEAITGENERIYLPGDKRGDFYVEIAKYGVCYVPSDVVSISNYPTGFPLDEDIGELEIYPNPTTGSFTIELNSSIFDELIFEIYSVQGSKVYRKSMQKGSMHVSAQFELGKLSPGIYYVLVRLGESRANRKLIIE